MRMLTTEQNTEVSPTWAVNSTSDDRQLRGELRTDEIVLLTIALTIWVMSIIMFVRRWTRLRVLEPLQHHHRYSPKNMDRVRIVHNPRHSIIYQTSSRRRSETVQQQQQQAKLSAEVRRNTPILATVDSLPTSPSPDLDPPPAVAPDNDCLILPPTSVLPANNQQQTMDSDRRPSLTPDVSRRKSSVFRGSIAAAVFRNTVPETPLTSPDVGDVTALSPVSGACDAGHYMYMVPINSSSSADSSDPVILTLTTGHNGQPPLTLLPDVTNCSMTSAVYVVNKMAARSGLCRSSTAPHPRPPRACAVRTAVSMATDSCVLRNALLNDSLSLDNSEQRL